MADLIFCDAASSEPLPFEEDGGYYVRTQEYIEAGFDYVLTTPDELMLFRKRK